MPMVMKSLLMLGGLLYLAQLTVNLHRQFQSPAWRLAVKALAALMTFYFVVALLGHYGGPDSAFGQVQAFRSEEHTSELQSLMRISYAVFCLKKKTIRII